MSEVTGRCVSTNLLGNMSGLGVPSVLPTMMFRWSWLSFGSKRFRQDSNRPGLTCRVSLIVSNSDGTSPKQSRLISLQGMILFSVCFAFDTLENRVKMPSIMLPFSGLQILQQNELPCVTAPRSQRRRRRDLALIG